MTRDGGISGLGFWVCSFEFSVLDVVCVHAPVDNTVRSYSLFGKPITPKASFSIPATLRLRLGIQRAEFAPFSVF